MTEEQADRIVGLLEDVAKPLDTIAERVERPAPALEGLDERLSEIASRLETIASNTGD